MKRFPAAVMVMSVVVLSSAFVVSSAWAGLEARKQAKKVNVELPPAVAQAVRDNVPNARIERAALEKESGVALYDIEFKDGRGEIEVASDGTVMDIFTVIILKDVPQPAVDAILRAVEGATIKQVEKSEVRAEIRGKGERGMIVKLDSPKYVYEAQLAKGEERAEIQVTPDGKIVETPEWDRGEAIEINEMEENEDAEEEEEANEEKPAAPVADLKILPEAVRNAFQTSYPDAVIKGASQETENGVTVYEVESVDGKMNRDLLYTADGKAVEIEESVAPGALPPAVLQTLAVSYPGYRILKAEDVKKDGRKLFELRIQVKDKKTTVTIDPQGKIIGK